MSSLYLLWDESQLWGLLAAHAAAGLQLPARLVSARDIAGGVLERDKPAMLLAPGGSARRKAMALGPKGLAAICEYTAGGGHYLGVCGGAGLALSTPPENKIHDGLGLSPWQRGAYADRMQHFISGHMRVELQPHPLTPAPPHDEAATPPLLPVWWPGRFSPTPDPGVLVLASYATPGPDFWLADLPTSALPEDAFSTWRDLYGINLSPAFLTGQPCLIHGEYGRGSYTLSYSHLETPASPFANRWFALLLESLGGIKCARSIVPEWDLGFMEQGAAAKSPRRLWEDKTLEQALDLLLRPITTGLEHGLFFRRAAWLLGWRPGMPGAQLCGLYAALHTAATLPPTEEARKFWTQSRETFMRNLLIFSEGVSNYLLAERLAMTLAKVPAKAMADAVSPDLLTAQRRHLFGHPTRPGGLYQELSGVADRLAFLQLTPAFEVSHV